MQYAHLLNLIDTYLDRLTKARQILATLDTPLKRTERQASLPPAVSETLRAGKGQKPVAFTLPISAFKISPLKKAESNQAVAHLTKVLETTASAWAADEQIRQGELRQNGAQMASKGAFDQMVITHPVPNVQAKTQRRTRSKRPSPPLARALGGLVPAMPIFIPADQICRELSLRDLKSEKAEHSFGSTATVPLTAELLTRRWVQGIAS